MTGKRIDAKIENVTDNDVFASLSVETHFYGKMKKESETSTKKVLK